MPTLAEHACLVLITQGASHGWAVGSLLTATSDLGRVYTLSRPLAYRAIDGLVEQGLVSRKQGSGSTRDPALLKATAAGRRAARVWLDTPVAHMRDVRVELLLKLLLRERAGLPLQPLLQAQLVALPFEQLLHAGDDADLVAVWRREQARAVQAFLHGALAEGGQRREDNG
ncbi:MAG: PadR family transcriptional regulator [Actinomycetota bacterium]